MLSVQAVIVLLLLFLLLLLLLVLFAAFDVFFRVKGSDNFLEHEIYVRWLMFSRQVNSSRGYGLPAEEEEVGKNEKPVSEKVTGDFQGKKKIKGEKRKKEKKTKKKADDISFSDVLQAFRQLRSPLIRLVKGIVNAIKIPAAKARIGFGFPDPAYTGMAYGYAHAMKGYLASRSEKLEIQLEPYFLDTKLDIDMSATVRIRLFRFVPVMIFFILNRNVLHFSWYFLMKKRGWR
ncbi:DUF2953 domain-containing protein [Methanolobus sp. WCC5]|uniref:DUF2953 domain-containing protein n=1 Tax=Methanolobus sp. WCC5 TaxID=3125785 RepID=UPI0032549672